MPCYNLWYMVTIAQLAERLTVAQNVVGSSPISHPKIKHPLMKYQRVFLFLGKTGEEILLDVFALNLHITEHTFEFSDHRVRPR